MRSIECIAKFWTAQTLNFSGRKLEENWNKDLEKGCNSNKDLFKILSSCCCRMKFGGMLGCHALDLHSSIPCPINDNCPVYIWLGLV